MQTGSQCIPAGRISSQLAASLLMIRIRLSLGTFLGHWCRALTRCGAVYAAATLVVALTAGITPVITVSLAAASFAVSLLYGGVLAFLTPHTEFDAAKRADKVLGLSERLSAALEFGGTDTPCAPLLVEAAREASPLVKAVRVAPIPWPKDAPAALIALMVAIAATLVPYGASLGVNKESHGDTRMAAEGYRLLEEARRVSAGAQAVGDQTLQRLGDDLGDTARKMTERFSSERKVERSLQKISQALSSIRQAETTRMGTLSEASTDLEEAYAGYSAGGAGASEYSRRMREAMRQGAEGARDPGLAERLREYADRPGEGPSESDILDAMQAMQEETAASQAREAAAGQAADALNQSMASLGMERPESQPNPGTGPEGGDGEGEGEGKSGQGTEPGSDGERSPGGESGGQGQGQDKGSGASGQPQGTDGQGGTMPDGSPTGTGQGKAGGDGGETPRQSQGAPQSPGGGGTGTEGGHFKALGSKGDMGRGAGDIRRVTGQKGKGTATSTTVLGSGFAPGTTGRSGGADYAGSFGTGGGVDETATAQERIPAQYRRIIAGYFGSGK